MTNALATINDISVLVHTPQPGTKAITIRRAVAQTPAIIDKLGPVERSVFLASAAKVAQEYSDAELIREMADTLKWVAMDVGVRDTHSPDWQITVVRLSQIFKRYYPCYSVTDIKMAFELTVTGELNKYLPKDRNGNPDKEHYQMFNAEYFCKIMNAYKDYRGNVIDKVQKLVPTPGRKDDAYYRNKTRQAVIDAYLYYKYHANMPELSIIMEMLAYDEMEKVGLVDVIEIPQDKTDILRQTMTKTQRQLISEEQREANQSRQYRKYFSQRNQALERAFAEMVKNEIQITDYIRFEHE